MNLKEDRKKEIEVLAKLAKVDVSKSKLYNLNKCYPYSNNCYNEPRHILYLSNIRDLKFSSQGMLISSAVIAVCDEHLENYTWGPLPHWKEL